MIVLSSILHCENIIFLHYTLFPFFPQLLPTNPRNSPVHNILFVPAELIIFSIDTPNDIAYLYRLAQESPLLYAELACKPNGLQEYVNTMNEFN